MHNFKIGDRVVKIKQTYDNSRTPWIKEQVGTIKYISDKWRGKSHIAVEWDIACPNEFHDCDKTCKDNHGYWVWHDDLELVDQTPYPCYATGELTDPRDLVLINEQRYSRKFLESII